MKGLRDCTQTAGAPLFVQFEDDSEREGVLEVKSSCVSLDMLCVMCLTTLFLCFYADMRDGISYGCYFYVENERLSVQCDDWKSFLEVQGCCFNAYFVLRAFESSYRTSPAS